MTDHAPDVKPLELFDEFLGRIGMSCDDFLFLLANDWRQSAAAEPNPLVRGCIESAAEHLSHAAMDFYVSTK